MDTVDTQIAPNGMVEPNDTLGAQPTTPRASPPPASSPPPSPPTDGNAASLNKDSPLWQNPLLGFVAVQHGSAEKPLRDYLECTPRPDDTGDWDFKAAHDWLDIGTNGWIRGLKALDPVLAGSYYDRIDLLQAFVEVELKLYRELLNRREEDRLELERLEEERRRVAAELEEKRRQEEEQARLAAEEAIRKERVMLIDKMKHLAATDPDLLAEVGIVRTYPAVAGGKCESCAMKGLTCRGVAGKSCGECTKAHVACSNSTGPRKGKGPTPDEPGKPTKSRRTRVTGTPSAASSSTPKRKVDDVGETNANGAPPKRAKTTTEEDLLPRSEAAELIGEVVMELEVMNNAFERARGLLGDFAARANGKKRVTITIRD